MNAYFPKSKSLEVNGKVKLDLSNYAAKVDLKMERVFIHQILLKKS